MFISPMSFDPSCTRALARCKRDYIITLQVTYRSGLHAASHAADDLIPYRRAMPTDIRPIRDDELASWFAAFGTAFYMWSSDPHAPPAARGPTRRGNHRAGPWPSRWTPRYR